MNTKNTKRTMDLAMQIDRAADFLINFFLAYAAHSALSRILADRPYHAPRDYLPQLLLFLAAACLVASLLYQYHNVYQPIRTHRMRFFIGRILLANAELSAIALLFIQVFASPPYAYLTAWLGISAVSSSAVLISKRICVMTALGSLRTNRRGLRRMLLVTDSQEMTDEYLARIHGHPHYGYLPIGYVGDVTITGLNRCGGLDSLDCVLDRCRPDEVVMAFATMHKKTITELVSVCNDHCVKVLFVPAVCGYFKSPRQVHLVGDLPVIDIRSNPLDNPANRLAKRTLDLLGSLLLLLLTSPLLLLLAIGVRISSPGPISFDKPVSDAEIAPSPCINFVPCASTIPSKRDGRRRWIREKRDSVRSFAAFPWTSFPSSSTFSRGT